jgi:hypothetical protein
LSIFLFRGDDSWRRRRVGLACLCALAGNIATTQALSAVHKVTAGYWGVTAVESHEWWWLYSTLLSLPVQRNDRHSLVSAAAMEMAESFSQDLRGMNACIYDSGENHEIQDIANPDIVWAVAYCLPGEEPSKKYARMRAISSDIIKEAYEHNIQLSTPALGIVPRPVGQWLPYFPSSVVRVALSAVRIPESTHLAQNSYSEGVFNRALLRRAALVAAGQNPEVFGYQSFLRYFYIVLSVLFWPSVPLILVILAAVRTRAGTKPINSAILAFFLSIVIVDILCRVLFYSTVDWILWEIPSRYVLGANVLSVVAVSTFLVVWLVPAAGGALGPRLPRFPGLSYLAPLGGLPRPPPDLKPPHSAAAAASRFGAP